MKNNTFEELAGVIKKADKVYIYPHINADGDALGSAAALCRCLRLMGKESSVIIEDGVPENLSFLDNGYCTGDYEGLSAPDLSICVDCGDAGRFPKRQKLFDTADVTMCIDHHKTAENYCDYNYIDSGAAATGQLIYHLILALGMKPDKETGEALFAAITTDTGDFQYSNTTKETHEIVAALYDAGIDANGVSMKIYENIRKEKLIIENMIIGTMETCCGGKVATAYVNNKMLEKAGALMEETEGVVQKLRSIGTVEAAIFFKEHEGNVIKVSMRSKRYLDVAEIAAELGGGGHARAAGCTIHCTLSEAMEKVKKIVTADLEKI